jgi:hypothetical protein
MSDSTVLGATEGAATPGGFPPIAPPTRRPLRIFALDPGFGHQAGNITSVEVGYEPLEPGPVGRLIRVIDYDGAKNCYYPPVDLNAPNILIRGGLEPAEADPRFHQQMIYAVAMKVVENFERALGRTFRFSRDQPLTILPHAFEGENAFYDPRTHALLFGYFDADQEDPRPNLPGQTVFTCLSQDIIAHEMTHAVIHRLRRYFNDPTNRDVSAFHEGIADIVAIFQHFTYPQVLRNHLQTTRIRLDRPGPLLELARQFGYTTGGGEALRTALDAEPDQQPDPALYRVTREAHERGSILVGAVFDAFFRIFHNRIRDLVRAATGGSGVLPEGDVQADLLDLVAAQAAQAAQDVLTMCLRAFEYLPPVDVTFGDYLRALVTADFDLNPHDRFERRASFIEAFRRRGIYATNVVSLAEESLRWQLPPAELIKWPLPDEVVQQALASEFQVADPTTGRRWRSQDQTWAVLDAYARDNARFLQLHDNLEPAVQGFHPTFRFDEEGQLQAELVAQWVQTPPEGDPRRVEDGGVVLRAGTTAVFAHDGTVRYVIAKPLPSSPSLTHSQQDIAQSRADAFHDYVAALDDEDPLLAWTDEHYQAERMLKRASMNAAHRRRRRILT